GTFKGGQPATRYEMASVLARSLAKLDLEKASKQDVEMMRKLVIEFSDELTALGVKLEQLDERVAVLETDIGGWSIAGQFQFDLKFTGDNEVNGFYADDADIVGKNEFDLNQYRLWLRKRVDENTTFEARFGRPTGGNAGARLVQWDRYFITTRLPYDITLTAGRQLFAPEDDLGLIQDNDTWTFDNAFDAMKFTKSWGVADILLAVARQNDAAWGTAGHVDLVGGRYDPTANRILLADTTESFLIAVNINANFSERFRAGLLGFWRLTDEEVDTDAVPGNDTDHDVSQYGVYAGFKFTPDIELKGVYYAQKVGHSVGNYAPAGMFGNVNAEDSSSAWKAILDVNQEALKFTSLWLEYGQMDNNYAILGGLNPYAYYGAEILSARPFNLNTTKILLVRAGQQWNDKWDTLLRYVRADFDTTGTPDASNWTFEVGYQYSPAVKFTLGYDNIDYGNYPAPLGKQDDHMIRFRTFVAF
ncbi:MAG: S-layer protein, partial [Synergistaceae bacterium]|nr:S-layer protein [Synergistaceae bacterium]